MEKICHLTTVHPIYDVRIYQKECVSLAAGGFDVSLIACTEKEFEEIRNGVKCISLNIPVKNRIHRFIKRSKTVYKKALEVDAEIYHFHDPELLFMGLKLKKKGKKVIFDSHEDITVNILDKNYIPKLIRPFMQYLFNKYASFVIKKLDGIITVTPHIVEKLKNINPKTFQITNFPIVDEEKIPSQEKIQKFSTPTIFFAGGVTPLFNHENIIKSLDRIEFDIKYLLAGPASSEYLAKLKKMKSWNKVEYLGIIPHDEVKKIYKKSHIGLAIANYSNNGGGKLGTIGNTKLFEIMLEEIPIICTDFILWKSIVEDNKAGICVNPSDIESITKAITKLVLNDSESRIMGQNGKKIVLEKYNWKTQESILIDIYKGIN